MNFDLSDTRVNKTESSFSIFCHYGDSGKLLECYYMS